MYIIWKLISCSRDLYGSKSGQSCCLYLNNCQRCPPVFIHINMARYITWVDWMLEFWYAWHHTWGIVAVKIIWGKGCQVTRGGATVSRIKFDFSLGCHFINAPLRWRHNERDGVSNHQTRDCLFRRTSNKTSKLRFTDLCAGKSPGPVNSLHKGPVTRKMFPFDEVIMDTLNSISVWFLTLSTREIQCYRWDEMTINDLHSNISRTILACKCIYTYILCVRLKWIGMYSVACEQI